jgi:hypothetical protein
MVNNAIEVEGASIDEAREKIKALVPVNHFILSETIIDDGEPKSVTETDITVEAAYKKAQSKLEGVFEIITKEVLSEPSEKIVSVQAFDKQTAQTLAQKQIQYSDSIISLSLVKKGSNGFLGIRKTPDQYDALVLSPARVKITFKRPAKISVNTAENKRNESENQKLTDYESRNQPFDVTCEQCNSRCRALAHPVASGTVMVMTPEIGQLAARYCENCHIIICGSCAGVSSYSLGPSGPRHCPRCGAEPIFAAACHVRTTEATLL